MSERFSVNGKAKPSNKPALTEFDAQSNVLRAKIGERLDHLTALWHENEKRLLALQQPRHVYHVYKDDNPSFDPERDDGMYNCYCLGIAKYAGKWRLCLGTFHQREMWEYGANISWCPVTDSSMEDRMEAAPYVKNLEQKIVETGEKIVPKLDEAIRHLENALACV
jgi:hypothetical protein